jgi:hypothetical protein
MVLMFDGPMVVVVLVDIRVVGTEASFQLGPQYVIRPTEAGSSSSRTGVSCVAVDVSVACKLWGGVANPMPDPLPLSKLGPAVGSKSTQAEFPPLLFFLFLFLFKCLTTI